MSRGLPLEGNRVLLRQGVVLLERLTDSEYAGSLRGRSPVGTQYRHILDHYHAFFRGLSSGRVDYDARDRDGLLERSRQAALSATREFLNALDALEAAPDRPLETHMDTGAGPDAPDWRPSSAGRELQFLCSHTVHHYALIKLLLDDLGQSTGRDFGVAPSTLAGQRSES